MKRKPTTQRRRPTASDRQLATRAFALVSDMQQSRLSAPLRKLLGLRFDALSRLHEAEAEIAMARSALAKVEARLVAMGYIFQR